MSEPVGILGLGLMGGAMARRLIACGRTVVGFDPQQDKLKAAAEAGVETAGSPAEVAARCETLLVCVTSTAAVEKALLGPGGVAEAARGGLLVDLSTTELEATKRIAAALKEKTGREFIDAPVSGGPGAAEQGSLAIMAGGSEAAYASAEPLLQQLGQVTRMGPLGAGQATKLVNQILVLNNYCVFAEAMALGERLGVEVAKIPEALGSGYAGGNLLNDLFPRMVERDFEPRGFARQILKDLHLVQDVARDQTLALPMSSTAAMLYRLLVGRGHGELDGGAIAKLYLDEPV